MAGLLNGSFAVAGAHGTYTAAGYEPGPFALDDLAGRGIRQLWLSKDAEHRFASSYMARPTAAAISVTIPDSSARLYMWRLAAWDLFCELSRFVEATGTPFVQSPAVTAEILLRRIHQGPGRRPIGRTAEPMIARRIDGRAPQGAEGDLIWWAAPDSVTDRRFVHHFDLNAAYLGSVSSLALPQGEPRLIDDPDLNSVMVKRPGYWLVDLPLPELAGWPPIARNRSMRAGAGRAWITTPTLALALSLGPVKARQAWVWYDSCQALRPWYETIRRARETLKAGAAYEAVKQTYKAGIGRLGSTLRTRENDPLYQPTWRHLVIAEARGRVWRRIAKAPEPPIAIQVDGAWWLSDIADPGEAAAYLGLPLDPIRLGCWKHQGTGAGPEAVEALAHRDPISRLREITGA